MDEENEYEKNYMRAIKAREHHYNNFNYWMNFYAIIIGALFVGYYTIKEDELLKTIITLIGFATTLAWLQSFRGYYHWIKQWINVVMFHEEQYIKAANLVENDKESNRVYTLYYESDEEDSHCPLKTRNISTQKMTLRLIFVLLLSWLILLVYNSCSLIGIHLCTICEKIFHCGCLSSLFRCLLMLILLAGMLIAIICLFCPCKDNDSDTTYHYRLKGHIDNYHIEFPKETNQNTLKCNNHKIEDK